MITLVEQGEVDLDFIYDPASRPEIVVMQELFRQPLRLLVPYNHPLTQTQPGTITLERIVAEPLIFLNEDARS